MIIINNNQDFVCSHLSEIGCSIEYFDSNEELEIFIAHQGADVEHSEAQYGILEKNYSKLDVSRIEEMVKRTFATSRAYEVMKLNFANSDKPLDHFFE